GARLLRAPVDPGPEIELLAAGEFQRRNFALATTAAEAFLGELDPAAVARVAATLTVPGRLERIAAEPPVLIDAAHNPDGARALAEALPAAAAGRRVVACLAVLADKDAAAMVAALAPVLDRAICTESPAPRAVLPADELAAVCAQAGLLAEAEPDFARALQRARELAAEPPSGVVLVAGSHYSIAPARAALHL
ncbi:MAG TPA: cyanophycin synthetase, partial [Solirubrobacterales bacterium]|nr:cyanophycin synthetase [Solirubrobacterales bacterium]